MYQNILKYFFSYLFCISHYSTYVYHVEKQGQIILCLYHFLLYLHISTYVTNFKEKKIFLASYARSYILTSHNDSRLDHVSLAHKISANMSQAETQCALAHWDMLF